MGDKWRGTRKGGATSGERSDPWRLITGAFPKQAAPTTERARDPLSRFGYQLCKVGE
jgi:hypothetical protein